MKKNMILLVLLAALLIMLVFVGNKKKIQKQEQEAKSQKVQTIPNLSIKDPNELKLFFGYAPNMKKVVEDNNRIKDRTLISIKFQNNNWYILQPIEWIGDWPTIMPLIDSFSSLEYKASIPVSQLQPSDIGINPNSDYISISNGETTIKLTVGNLVFPDNQNYYVQLSNHENMIFAIDKNKIENFRKGVEELKNKSVFQININDVRRANVKKYYYKNEQGSSSLNIEEINFTYNTAENVWQVTGIEKEKTNTTEAFQNVKKVLDLRASRIIEDKKDLELIDKSKVIYLIEVELSNKSVFSTNIYKKISQDGKPAEEIYYAIPLQNYKDAVYELAAIQVQTDINVYIKRDLPK